MFCWKCGNKVPDGAKFCMNCGSSLENMEESISNNDSVLDNEKKEFKIVKEFNLFNGKVSINETVDRTVEIRRKFKKYSIESGKEIVDKYYSLENMINVAEQIPTIGYSMLEKYIDKSVQILVEKNIYNIDSHTFKEKYYNITKIWDASCENALSDFGDIMNELIRKQQEHEQLASSHGTWEGGGFGLEGAIKGAVTATALNIATDMAFGALEAGANKLSENAAMKKLETAYKSYSTVEKFKKIMEDVVFEMNEALITALNENGNEEYYVVGEEKLESARIINNLQVIRNKEETLLNLLNNYPFSVDALTYAYENDIGNKKEISDFADYLEIEIVPMKHMTLIEKTLINLNYDEDIRGLYNAKEYIINTCEKYKINGSHYIEFLDKKIEEVKTKVLAFDGNDYSSIEECLQARDTLEEVMNTVSKTDNTDRNTMYQCVTVLKESNIISKSKYIDYLNDEINKANIKAKTVLGVQLNNEEQAKVELQHCRNIYETLTNLKCNSLEDLTNLKKYVEDNLSYQIGKEYISRINELINIYQKSNEYLAKYQNFNFNSRLENTTVVTELNAVNNVLKKYKIMNVDFNDLCMKLTQEYLMVYGEKYSTIDIAIEKYVDLINHANSYKKYEDEKKNSKSKGFLGALKSNVSGLVNARYEKDYLRVTEDRRNPLPRDTKDELNKIYDCIGKIDTLTKKYENTIEYAKLQDPFKDDTEKLSMNNLYEPCEKQSMSNVIGELKEVLTGKILSITNSQQSTYVSVDEIAKNLKSINQYYFEELNNAEIIETVKNKEVSYIVTYKYIIEIEENASFLNSQNIKIELN